MQLLWHYLFAFLIATVVVFQSIPTIKKIALRCGQVDQPDPRKVHQRPIVRLGGIAICGGTLFAVVAVGQHFGLLSEARIIGLLAGSFGFFLIGFADDLYSLSPIIRLFLQAGVGSLVWLSGVQIEFLTVPGMGIVHLGWFSLPLTLVWLMGVVNAINWMDGLDGLASGIATIAAVMIFMVCLAMNQPVAALMMAAMVGSLLGFLYYNFNPAAIFMGDGGSYFIGFTLAATSIIGLVKSAAAIAIFIPCLILAVPLLDMTVVILARLWHRRSPFTADKRHLHHRLLQIGLSHRFTVYVMYALTLWAGSLALTLAGIPHGVVLLSSATGLLGCTTWKVWQVMQRRSLM